VVPPSFDSELLRTLRALDAERHALFASHGLRARFRVSDVLSPRGTAVFTTAALVGEAPEAGVELVGPSRGGARGGESVEPGFGAGRPLVYVSFGSQAWHQPRRFEVLAAAAARLDVAMVMAMGDLAAAWAQRTTLDPRLRCLRHAAQLELLGRAALLVSHGGANSVMEALDAGVPVLVAPICNDQPHNLLFLERAGAGAGIDLDHAGVDAVCSAMSALLDARSPARAAAARVSASYATHDGAAGAAELALRALP
jgi:zeaxanthin glucosyltransferase